jgi:predicted phage terminase large subunit-like protein
LAKQYIDGLLDPVRMGPAVLRELEADLGQYGYAGQILQRPAPPGGGMFKTEKIEIIERPPHYVIAERIRYWDKAATDAKENPGSAFTAGVLAARLTNGKYAVLDVVRGQWATDEREDHIKQVAQLDGVDVKIWVEQEPGSGGKDSARGTIKNLAGYSINAESVGNKGDKVRRADPFSVQVNWGNVCMVRAEWNQPYLDEMKTFPFGKRKDQIDASAGGFNKLALPAKKAGVW